jgi:hypothetical protein
MVQEETHESDESQSALFAVWPHLTRGDIFSEAELPQPLFKDSPLPQEKDVAATGRPFLTEDDVKRWWNGEVFSTPQEIQSTVRMELPTDAVEAYRRIAEAQGVSIPEGHQWSSERVRQPSIQDHLDVVRSAKNGFGEPPALTRKGFWPGFGPVRYRREYTRSPPRQSFRDFFPEEKIGEIPLRPDFDKRVVVIGQGEGVQLSGYFPLPKCALGG